jgi:hypothetical protein
MIRLDEGGKINFVGAMHVTMRSFRPPFLYPRGNPVSEEKGAESLQRTQFQLNLSYLDVIPNHTGSLSLLL